MKPYLPYMVALLFTSWLLLSSDCSASYSNAPGKDFDKSWAEYMNHKTELEPTWHYPYEACFQEAARRHDLPLTLLLAVARGESDFNAKAQSSKSCIGIMQIQWPGTARDLGFTSLKQLYEPCRNIDAGARYLKKMVNRYDGDLHLALAAYNYGPGRIPRNAKSHAIPEGANWYSGYIFHHLQQVLHGPDANAKLATTKPKYSPGDKIPVILFHSPTKAKRFLDYFKSRIPDIPLDWFRTPLGETYIVLIADSEKQNNTYPEQLKRHGYTLNTAKVFR